MQQSLLSKLLRKYAGIHISTWLEDDMNTWSSRPPPPSKTASLLLILFFSESPDIHLSLRGWSLFWGSSGEIASDVVSVQHPSGQLISDPSLLSSVNIFTFSHVFYDLGDLRELRLQPEVRLLFCFCSLMAENSLNAILIHSIWQLMKRASGQKTCPLSTFTRLTETRVLWNMEFTFY